MFKYKRSALSPVVSEVHLYCIALQDLTKPLEPRYQPLMVGKYYTRDAALAKSRDMNKTCQYELDYLGYTSFVPYNMEVV